MTVMRMMDDVDGKFVQIFLQAAWPNGWMPGDTKSFSIKKVSIALCAEKKNVIILLLWHHMPL